MKSKLILILLAGMTLILPGLAADRPDVLIADFEGNDYGDWKAIGEAFGPAPVRGTLPNQMQVDGFMGKGLVNSYFDHIIQSDLERKAGPASLEVIIKKRYLHFPVKNGAPKVRGKVTTGETVVDEFDIELAPAEPDFWVFLDMERFRESSATIQMSRVPDDSLGLVSITQSDKAPGANDLYRETYRPQFHFSSRRGWNNDPNGLVYYKGEYHLYYQHNPYGWDWGNMHWGHAVSRDLAHWEELPIAIYPCQYGDWVFSGSATVDKNNTAGFKTGDEDVIVAAYTSTGRGEAIAYSNDRGRTFADYKGNPVVKHRGRDPKIIWHAPGKHWVMAVYDEHEETHNIAFYTSQNLKSWKFQSRMQGYYECPEIFELPVDGDKNNTRWVVYAADGAYAYGSFDGKTFTPEHQGKHRFNWGNCFYASQTFNDIPSEDGRRIQIAWGRIGHRSMPFNQQMNFPVELTLRTTDEGIRMFAEPVAEIELLRAQSHKLENITLNESQNPLADISGELFHIVAAIEPGDAAQVELNIRGEPVTYDARRQELLCKDHSAPVKPVNGQIQLELLVDRLSIEIFANAGRIYMPIGVALATDNHLLQARAKGGKAVARSLDVHELTSAWLQ